MLAGWADHAYWSCRLTRFRPSRLSQIYPFLVTSCTAYRKPGIRCKSINNTFIENCQKIDILKSPPPENVTENQVAVDEYFSLLEFFENQNSAKCNVDDYCVLRNEWCDNRNNCNRGDTANFLDGTDSTDEDTGLCPSKQKLVFISFF